MRLQVNEEKSGVRQLEDVQFLGFRFRCAKKGGDIAIFPSRKAEQGLKITLRETTPPNWGRSIASCMTGVSRYLAGRIA
jgi:RNA-directed DNA polymerase